MQVSLILEITCGCGETVEGVMVRSVRINKGSMRTLGQGFGFLPRKCKACGAPLPDTATATYRLTDDDLAKVNEYRAGKGWPPLPAVPTTEEETHR